MPGDVDERLLGVEHGAEHAVVGENRLADVAVFAHRSGQRGPLAGIGGERVHDVIKVALGKRRRLRMYQPVPEQPLSGCCADMIDACRRKRNGPTAAARGGGHSRDSRVRAALTSTACVRILVTRESAIGRHFEASP